MTTQSTSEDRSATRPPPGAFERLAAFDGLFLRSEHLNLMQEYAYSVAAAVASAGGPGIVWGFEVSLSQGKVNVSPGLAVMDDGRPLRSNDLLQLEIDELTAAAGIYYEVRLGWDTWQEGEEAVQGLLCDSGCGDNGAVRSARLLEGPSVLVTKVDRVTELASHTDRRRSWLASYLFEEEDDALGRLPRGYDTELPLAWRPMAPPPVRDSLPLAVLLPPRGDGAWELDTWMVRRDRGAAPPRRYWEGRLRMRPWDVFLAQVLQFQAQVADEATSSGTAPDTAKVRSTLKEQAQASRRLAAAFQGRPEQADLEALSQQTTWLEEMLSRSSIARLSPGGARRAKGSVGPPGGTLIEIPPAGFLPCSSDGLETVRDAVETYLASPGLVRRVCRCSLGDVGRLFEDAQHRDRTTLASPGTTTGETQAIDVHVPSEGDRATTTWVLFTRTERLECPEHESPQEDSSEKPSAAEEASAPSTRASARTRSAKPAAKKPGAAKGQQ